LAAWVIIEKMEYFSPLKPVVPEHMKHKYIDSMRQKSDMVGTACYLTIHIQHLVITEICDKVALHFTNPSLLCRYHWVYSPNWNRLEMT